MIFAVSSENLVKELSGRGVIQIREKRAGRGGLLTIIFNGCNTNSRIMRLQIIFLGKTKKQYIVEAIDDFFNRLRRYVQVEIKVLKEKRGKGQSDILQKKEEGRQLLECAGKKSYKVALDPHGKEFSSTKFSRQLSLWEQQNRQDIVFLIGGPLGLSEEVKSQADMLLSLSKMTFTHDMTRMLLVEQLYRAFSIKAGSKYHK